MFCSDCKKLIRREMSVDWRSTFVRPFRPHRFVNESADDMRLRFVADRHQVNIPPIFWIEPSEVAADRAQLNAASAGPLSALAFDNSGQRPVVTTHGSVANGTYQGGPHPR
jgi:hypothetical protein